MNHRESYDFFPAEAVNHWVDTKLGNYYKEDDAASLMLGTEPTAPEVLVKFAELAKVMKLPIVANYQTLHIKRPKSLAEQRKHAVDEMQLAYEKGDIDASGHTVERQD